MSEPTATYEWRQLPWRKLEVAVFKLQRRIYRASQDWDGTYDKADPLEEPCARKLARTVVRPVKASAFSRRQSCQGKSQTPCS
jgi:hypothetical protein